MKRPLVALALVWAMTAALLSGCGSARPSAQAVTEQAIQAVQNLDTEALQRHFGTEEEALLPIDGEDGTEFLRLATQNLTYKILSSQEDPAAGQATVTVEFTNTDMAKVLAAFLQSTVQDIMTDAFLPEDQQPTQEELAQRYTQKLTELLSQEDPELKTATVDVPLTLEEDQWRIQTDDLLLDAMFGGLLSAAQAMESAIGEL